MESDSLDPLDDPNIIDHFCPTDDFDGPFELPAEPFVDGPLSIPSRLHDLFSIGPHLRDPRGPFANVNRRWELFTPTSGRIAGTVIMMHGLGGNGGLIRANSGLDAIGELLNLQIIYPYGRSSRPRGKVCYWDFWTAAERNVDIQFLQRLCQQFAGGAKVVVGGFSAGACLANTAACAMPEAVAGVLSYAGYLGKGWELPVAPAGSLLAYSALVIRNTTDELVKEPESLALVSSYQQAGHNAQYLWNIPASGSAPDTALGRRGHFYDQAGVNAVVQNYLALVPAWAQARASAFERLNLQRVSDENL